MSVGNNNFRFARFSAPCSSSLLVPLNEIKTLHCHSGGIGEGGDIRSASPHILSHPTHTHTCTHTQRYGLWAIVSAKNESHCCPGPRHPRAAASFLPSAAPFLHASPPARHGCGDAARCGAPHRGRTLPLFHEPMGIARRPPEANRNLQPAARCWVIGPLLIRLHTCRTSNGSPWNRRPIKEVKTGRAVPGLGENSQRGLPSAEDRRHWPPAPLQTQNSRFSSKIDKTTLLCPSTVLAISSVSGLPEKISQK